MESKNTAVMTNIQDKLQSMDLKKPTLSTLAQKGDDELVEQFLTENINLGSKANETTQSQLYIASFWGLHDVIKELLQSGADPNFRNEQTKWTPLHAASFQEHGKVIMLLLDAGADPDAEDLYDRTPKDFASASDKVWSFFAAKGCQRTSRQDLISKRILQNSYDGFKAPPDFTQGRKSTASALLRFDDEQIPTDSEGVNAYNAAVNGDVLAGSNENNLGKVVKPKQDKPSEQPSFSAWRS
ncbi:inactive serine/threonine-protein kinase TEX14-like [Rhopilema esculentum]|uniref:inactive serine/threonine-protein kinase TEX14-like n=1 Tax=Rhopilema esculentum TaxID=499914 RepID=UPI0031D61ECB